MKQFSLLEIVSNVVLLANVVVVVADLSGAAHRCTHAPCGMLAVLPTRSFGDVDHLVIQIFALHVRCKLVPQWWPHCSTVCKVATAPLLQTKIALSPRALPMLHGLCHQRCHPIKRLLSTLLTHHFLVMDVDCC